MSLSQPWRAGGTGCCSPHSGGDPPGPSSGPLCPRLGKSECVLLHSRPEVGVSGVSTLLGGRGASHGDLSPLDKGGAASPHRRPPPPPRQQRPGQVGSQQGTLWPMGGGRSGGAPARLRSPSNLSSCIIHAQRGEESGLKPNPGAPVPTPWGAGSLGHGGLAGEQVGEVAGRALRLQHAGLGFLAWPGRGPPGRPPHPLGRALASGPSQHLPGAPGPEPPGVRPSVHLSVCPWTPPPARPMPLPLPAHPSGPSSTPALPPPPHPAPSEQLW